MIKEKKIFLSIFLCILLLFPILLQGRELDYPSFPGIQAWQGTLTDFFRYFYQILLGIGAILAFGYFILGGFLYFTSFGNPARLSRAKDLIISALWGLFILFASYAILSTIDPALTVFNIQVFRFTLPSLTAVPCDSYDNKQDCREAGCYWYNGKCHSQPPKTAKCYKIPLHSYFLEIHNTEKEALLIAKQIEELVFGPQPGSPGIMPIIEEIRELTKQCDCKKCRKSVCINPEAGCPECPAFCPPSDIDPCEEVRDRINELLEEIEKQGLEAEMDLISLLEEKIKKLTELKMEFEKYRRKTAECRQDIERHLLLCSEAKDYFLEEDLECKELDFWCCL